MSKDATNCGDYKLQITNSKILLEKNYDKTILKVCLKTNQSGNLTQKNLSETLVIMSIVPLIMSASLIRCVSSSK